MVDKEKWEEISNTMHYAIDCFCEALDAMTEAIRKALGIISEAIREISKKEAQKRPPRNIGATCTGHRRRVRPCARSCC